MTGRVHELFGPMPPDTLHIEITGKCNLMCRYCYNADLNVSDKIKREITPDNICKIIRQARSLGFNHFSISGGEPFLKPGLDRIIDECRGAHLTIFTSAMALNDQWIEKVVSSPQIQTLRVSLDGLDTNDIVRVGSSWEIIIENIKNIKSKRNLNIEINTMMTAYNIPELPDFYKKLTEISINRWNLDIPTFTARMREERNRELYNVDFDFLVEQLSVIISQFNSDTSPFRLSIRYIFDSSLSMQKIDFVSIKDAYSNFLFPPNVHPCIFEKIIVLKPDGSITRCSSHDQPLASMVNSESFERLLIASEKSDFMQIKDLIKCKTCRYLCICGGGCRANAKYFSGSELNSDPLACSLLPRAEKYIWGNLPEVNRNIYMSLLNPDGDMPEIKKNLLDCCNNL